MTVKHNAFSVPDYMPRCGASSRLDLTSPGVITVENSLVHEGKFRHSLINKWYREEPGATSLDFRSDLTARVQEVHNAILRAVSVQNARVYDPTDVTIQLDDDSAMIQVRGETNPLNARDVHLLDGAAILGMNTVNKTVCEAMKFLRDHVLSPDQTAVNPRLGGDFSQEVSLQGSNPLAPPTQPTPEAVPSVLAALGTPRPAQAASEADSFSDSGRVSPFTASDVDGASFFSARSSAPWEPNLYQRELFEHLDSVRSSDQFKFSDLLLDRRQNLAIEAAIGELVANPKDATGRSENAQDMLKRLKAWFDASYKWYKEKCPQIRRKPKEDLIKMSAKSDAKNGVDKMSERDKIRYYNDLYYQFYGFSAWYKCLQALTGKDGIPLFDEIFREKTDVELDRTQLLSH